MILAVDFFFNCVALFMTPYLIVLCLY